MRWRKLPPIAFLLSCGYYLECPHAGHGLIADIRVEFFIGDASVFAGRE